MDRTHWASLLVGGVLGIAAVALAVYLLLEGWI